LQLHKHRSPLSALRLPLAAVYGVPERPVRFGVNFRSESQTRLDMLKARLGLRASVAPPEASASVNKHDAFALASTSSKKRAHNSNGFAQCVRVITLAQSSSAAGETRPSLAKT